MASYKTGAPEAQNQTAHILPEIQSGNEALDLSIPKSEVTEQLESSNQALQLKLQALQKELEQTQAEISAVDHVLEVAKDGKS